VQRVGSGNLMRDSKSGGHQRQSKAIERQSRGNQRSLSGNQEAIKGDQGRSREIKWRSMKIKWISHPDKAAPGLIEASVIDDDVDGAHVPNLPPE